MSAAVPSPRDLRGMAAELEATTAGIAADVRVFGRACPASLGYARDLIGELRAAGQQTASARDGGESS